MARTVSGLIATLVLASPASAADLPKADPARVDRIVKAALQAWDVPGVAVVVVRGGEVVVLKGYGVKEVGKPAAVTADTVFPLASCTKAVTTTLLAMLVDDGRVGWDDPARKHLPEFRLSDPHADALVTVRDLVSHRTGVSGHDLLWYRAPWDAAEVLRRIPHLPVEEPFRGAYRYSTIMLMAAGKAAASAAGRPWEALVKDRIGDPLGMTGLTFTTADPAFAKADKATGHRRGKDGRVGVMPRYEVAGPNPAGSVNLSARDLAAWVKFQLAGGVANGKRLVSEANLAETRTPQIPVPTDRRFHPDTVQTSYGMGWLVYDYRGRRVVAHGGMIDGFRTQVTLLPDDGVGIGLLNNLHDTKMNQALGNALIDHLLGLPAKDWNGPFLAAVRDDEAGKKAERERTMRARRKDVPPSLAIEKYAGRYDDPAYGTGRVTAADGRLVWEWSSFRCPLEHFEGDSFRIADGMLEDQLVSFRVMNGKPDAAAFSGRVFIKGE